MKKTEKYKQLQSLRKTKDALQRLLLAARQPQTLPATGENQRKRHADTR